MERDGFVGGAPPPPAVIRRVDPRLVIALRTALYAVAAVSLASFLAARAEIGAFDDLRALGTVGRELALQAEQVGDGFVDLVLAVGAAAGLLTLVWWHRSYRAIVAAEAQGRRWSPGWAIGGWFIPVANLVIVKSVLDEIDRVSGAVVAGEPSWRSHPRLAITGWWWALWVCGLVVGVVGSAIVGTELTAAAFDADAYRTGLEVLMVAHALSVAASFCGAAAVRVLGDRLRAG